VYFVGLSVGFPLYTLRRFALFCVLRGALRFLIYTTLLIKKNISIGRGRCLYPLKDSLHLVQVGGPQEGQGVPLWKMLPLCLFWTIWREK
jgi:hypothetical protein